MSRPSRGAVERYVLFAQRRNVAVRAPWPGARAHNPADFEPYELLAGTWHELEHTSDIAIAMQIAMDHLAERRDYYRTLAPNPGKGRGGKRWIQSAIRRPGKLGGEGFLDRPLCEQREILDTCVDQYGLRSCMGSIMLLERVQPAARQPRLRQLHRYLAEHHGREALRANPDHGRWAAIPLVCVPHEIGGVTLTRAQVVELETLST